MSINNRSYRRTLSPPILLLGKGQGTVGSLEGTVEGVESGFYQVSHHALPPGREGEGIHHILTTHLLNISSHAPSQYTSSNHLIDKPHQSTYQPCQPSQHTHSSYSISRRAFHYRSLYYRHTPSTHPINIPINPPSQPILLTLSI